MKLPKYFVLLFIICSAFMLNACAVVQPWERERLSDPNMMFDEDPMNKGAELHYLFIREGTEGGDGSQSGGCGCG
ncbi:MAG: DUF4266 domain-containing protein [Ignavibacteria bacterium]|nr:DUF4266 domain-containing protein [Ignavibacteria bacterium]